jgi:hypothetical protein
VTGAHGDLGDGEGAAAARQHVLVEHGVLRTAAARAAQMHSALLAGLVARVILPRAPSLRHALVVAADAGPHLPDQAALERAVGSEYRLGVAALRLQVLANLGLQNIGLLQQFLELLRAQPGIVVGQRKAVSFHRDRLALCRRRTWPLDGRRLLGEDWDHERDACAEESSRPRTSQLVRRFRHLLEGGGRRAITWSRQHRAVR